MSARRTDGPGWETNSLVPSLVAQISRLVAADGNRPLVVVNACQSGREGFQLTGIGGFARAFLAAKAGIFVGTLWSVIDRPARIFVEALYNALLDKKTLAEAATIARAASAKDEVSSWLAYAVYGDPNARLVVD